MLDQLDRDIDAEMEADIERMAEGSNEIWSGLCDTLPGKADDPDAILGDWVRRGFLIGIENPIPSRPDSIFSIPIPKSRFSGSRCRPLQVIQTTG